MYNGAATATTVLASSILRTGRGHPTNAHRRSQNAATAVTTCKRFPLLEIEMHRAGYQNIRESLTIQNQSSRRRSPPRDPKAAHTHHHIMPTCTTRRPTEMSISAIPGPASGREGFDHVTLLVRF